MSSVEWITRYNDIPKVTPEVERAATQAISNALATTITVADPLTPVDTGALKANKTIILSGLSGAVTWNQEYAIYQEMGTIHIAGKHFAKNGSETARPKFLEEMKAIGRGLGR